MNADPAKSTENSLRARLPPDRQNISDALHSDRQLDIALFQYAETGTPTDLADAMRLAQGVLTALENECKVIDSQRFRSYVIERRAEYGVRLANIHATDRAKMDQQYAVTTRIFEVVCAQCSAVIGSCGTMPNSIDLVDYARAHTAKENCFPSRPTIREKTA